MLRGFAEAIRALKASSELNGSGSGKMPSRSHTATFMLKGFQLSRPQLAKEIWSYIKSHNLQDPLDKRYIRCDSAIRMVFKTDRVHMFTMNKLLSKHLQ